MDENNIKIRLDDTLLGNVFIFTYGMQSFLYIGGEVCWLMEIDQTSLNYTPAHTGHFALLSKVFLYDYRA